MTDLACNRCGNPADRTLLAQGWCEPCIEQWLPHLSLKAIKAAVSDVPGGLGDVVGMRPDYGPGKADLVCSFCSYEWIGYAQEPCPACIALEEASPNDDGASPQAWPTPHPLGVTTRTPPWPAQVLPEWLDAMVDGVADELQAPRDLPGMLGIGMLAVIFGGHASIRVRGSWVETLNLYTVTALPPSVGKSPAVKLMAQPVEEWLSLERDRIVPEIERAKQRRRMIEAEMNKAEKAGEAAVAGARLDELSSIDVPVVPQFWTDDATPEAFVKRLHEHAGRMSIVSTEGGVFQLMGGRYSDQIANLDPYLKAWSGDTIVVDRVGRDSYIITKPTTSIVVTVQPSVLEAIGANTENRSRGLSARFMMSIPPSMVGTRNLIDGPTLDDHVRDEYGRQMLKLMSLARNIPHGHVMQLDEQARRAFLTWRQGLESRRAGDLEPLAEWTTKLESSTARVAGLLHLAYGYDYDAPVEFEVMERAICLADYWIQHAVLAHQLWDADSALAGARRILDWLAGMPEEPFTARDVHRALRRHFINMEAVAQSVELLIDRGWVRSDDPDGRVTARARGQESPTLRGIPNLFTLWTSTTHVTHVTCHLKTQIHSISSSSEEGLRTDPRDIGDMVTWIHTESGQDEAPPDEPETPVINPDEDWKF